MGENKDAEIEIANTHGMEVMLRKSLEAKLVLIINDKDWGEKGNKFSQYLVDLFGRFTDDLSELSRKLIYVLDGF